MRLLCLQLVLLPMLHVSVSAGQGFSISLVHGGKPDPAAGWVFVALEKEKGTETSGKRNSLIVQEKDPHPDMFLFAQYLFEEERWEEAAVEFQRFCYFHSGDPLVPEARLKIGTCYERGKRFAEAVGEYQSLVKDHPLTAAGREARYRIGEVYYKAGKFDEAAIALERVLKTESPGPWKWKAMYRIAWASLQVHAFSLAAEQFSELAATENPYQEAAGKILEGIQGILGLRYRSPFLSGFLSGILPGAGQVYAGSYRDGVLSFLVNSALIGASYEAFDKEVYAVGGVVSFVALTFYAGNIYGAVNSTHHANQETLMGHLRSFRNRYEWITEEEKIEDRDAGCFSGKPRLRISKHLPGILLPQGLQ